MAGEPSIEGVDVKTDHLLSFGKGAKALAKSSSTDLTTATSGMSDPGIGKGGTGEGVALAMYHGAVLEQFGGLLKDLPQGLMSLGFGADSAAIAYITGDDNSASTVAAVESAFYPANGHAFTDGTTVGGKPVSVDVPDSATLPVATTSNPYDSSSTMGTTGQKLPSEQHKATLDDVYDSASQDEAGGYPQEPTPSPGPSPTPSPTPSAPAPSSGGQPNTTPSAAPPGTAPSPTSSTPTPTSSPSAAPSGG